MKASTYLPLMALLVSACASQPVRKLASPNPPEALKNENILVGKWNAPKGGQACRPYGLGEGDARGPLYYFTLELEISGDVLRSIATAYEDRYCEKPLAGAVRLAKWTDQRVSAEGSTIRGFLELDSQSIQFISPVESAPAPELGLHPTVLAYEACDPTLLMYFEINRIKHPNRDFACFSSPLPQPSRSNERRIPTVLAAAILVVSGAPTSGRTAEYVITSEGLRVGMPRYFRKGDSYSEAKLTPAEDLRHVFERIR